MIYFLLNQRGIALIITLLVLVLLITMVVEFSYGLYTGTVNLYNWIDSQRLYLMARSGINITAKYIKDWIKTQTYTPGIVNIPIEADTSDYNALINVIVEDESSKFNINMIVNKRGEGDLEKLEAFKRLLKALDLREEIAYRILDWIDIDKIEKVSGSERNAKNHPFNSIDEVLLIDGINIDDYNKLKSYITIYGDGRININGAELPVLKALSNEITDSLAQRIIDYRKNLPFEEVDDIFNVNGFQTIGQSLIGHIRTKGEDFSIRSEASFNGIKKVIDATIHVKESSPAIVLYWKEY